MHITYTIYHNYNIYSLNILNTMYYTKFLPFDDKVGKTSDIFGRIVVLEALWLGGNSKWSPENDTT